MAESCNPKDEGIITNTRVAADKHRFAATEEAFNKFIELITLPLNSTEKLNRLARRPSPFSAEQPY